MKRTYGSLQLVHGEWVLNGVEPHVSIRLKQLFPRIPKADAPPYSFPNDFTSTADLHWFTQRYPMKMTEADLASLQGGFLAFEDMQAEMERILLPDYQPPKYSGMRAPYELRHYQAQAVELLNRAGGLLIGDEVGLGKAQPLDAKVLTPTGFREMGGIKIGDRVIAADGSIANVIGVYPQGERDTYKVNFGDGASVECCEDHLWHVIYRDDRISRKGTLTPRPQRIKTTRQLIDENLYVGSRPKWQVPMCAPADFDAGGDRPIEPYLLGVLLGDGGMTAGEPRFTTADEEIAEAVAAAVPAGLRVKKVTGSDPYAYSIGVIRPPGRRKPPNEMRLALAKLGLWGKLSLHKFIPRAYLDAPASVRLSVLQGLMDTDGYAMPLPSGTATAQFYSSSEQLALDVRWIARSLGGIGRLTAKWFKGRTRYTVTVKLPEPLNPFRLDRKSAVWGDGHSTYLPRRFIKSIERASPKPMQCIEIDHPSRLYVTDDFVVTHNTVVSAGAFLSDNALPGIVVCQAHLQQQWAAMIAKFTTLWPHCIKGTRPYSLPHADVYIFRYTQIVGWVDVIAAMRPGLAVFDEIQELRRGEGTSSTPVLKGRAAKRIADASARRAGLSATPIMNYGGEIYNIMQFLRPEVLGPRDDFIREWGAIGERLSDPRALGAFLREQHAFLRRTKKDVGQEMPAVNKIVDTIDYDAEAVRSIDDLAHQLAIKATTGSFVERGQAVRDLDVMVRQQTGIAKAKHVAAIVRIIAEGGTPLVLMGWHRECYRIWLEDLADLKPAMYTGSESAGVKSREAHRFLDGDTNILIMSLRSGSGLDGLQFRCSTMVFGELDWSPGQHHQAIGRLDRDGQTEPVTALFLVVDEGSDPPMMEVLGLKASEASQVVDPSLGVTAAYSDHSHLKALVDRYLTKKGRAA